MALLAVEGRNLAPVCVMVWFAIQLKLHHFSVLMLGDQSRSSSTGHTRSVGPLPIRYALYMM